MIAWITLILIFMMMSCTQPPALKPYGTVMNVKGNRVWVCSPVADEEENLNQGCVWIKFDNGHRYQVRDIYPDFYKHGETKEELMAMRESRHHFMDDIQNGRLDLYRHHTLTADTVNSTAMELEKKYGTYGIEVAEDILKVITPNEVWIGYEVMFWRLVKDRLQTDIYKK